VSWFEELRPNRALDKDNGRFSMSLEKNVQIVKDFLAALGRRNQESLQALAEEDIEWIIPGENWPLAGTYRGARGIGEATSKS
jgi:uncharacterized protein